MPNDRVLELDTEEYLNVTVRCSVTLNAQPVAFSFDRKATWHTAAWIGDAGTTRTARVLVGSDVELAAGSYLVYVRVTDAPEVPIVRAGMLTVRA